MDFIDPKANRRHTWLLLVGYVAIGGEVFLVAIILLYLVYGFGIGKNGQVIQKGLVFVSSRPSPAQISLPGVNYSGTTNTRLTLPSGKYDLKLSRNGYRPWQRPVIVEGGTVEHIDYPFLIPQKLISTPVDSYKSLPRLATQSPDHRWLILQMPASPASFEVYDQKNPKLPGASFSLPAGLTSPGQTKRWQVVAWADDNRHLLLKALPGGASEYILLDREQPSSSIDLTKTLALAPSQQLSLSNKKYNQYFIYTPSGGVLSSASLSSPRPEPLISGALSYKTYGNDVVLYVSAAKSSDPKKPQVDVKLLMSGQTYEIRQLPAHSAYLLDLTQYSGTWYVVAGATSTSRVYIYKDPVGQIEANPGHWPAAISALRVNRPSWESFSSNARFVVAENGRQFSVYDAENDRSFNYELRPPLDAPQTHTSWMDGNHLDYVSRGKLTIFDFDGHNLQTLSAASPAYLPFFSPDYKFVDTLTTAANGKSPGLSSTALLIPSDQ